MYRNLGYLKDKQVKIIRRIEDREWEEIEKAEEQLMMYSINKQLYNMVYKNFIELMDQIENYKVVDLSEVSIDGEELDSIFQEICRLLLNYLSMIRTYLDHWETKLKKIYGKISDEVSAFKAKCSEQYDGKFSYRFMYKLRNYAQHCGVPVGKISAKIVHDQITDKQSAKIEVFFQRESLLNNFDSWGTVVREDLKTMPESFEISTYIKEMNQSIQIIHSSLIEMQKQDLIASLKTFFKYVINKIELRTPVIVTAHSESEYKAGNFGFYPLSLHLIKPIASDLVSIGVTTIMYPKSF